MRSTFRGLRPTARELIIERTISLPKVAIASLFDALSRAETIRIGLLWVDCDSSYLGPPPSDRDLYQFLLFPASSAAGPTIHAALRKFRHDLLCSIRMERSPLDHLWALRNTFRRLGVIIISTRLIKGLHHSENGF